MFTNTKKDALGYFFLSIILILAFLARVLWLGNIPGLNGDEAWYGVQVVGNRPILWQTPSGNLVNPFYMLPLWVIQRFFPPAVWVLRLPAILAGVLLVILGYFLLRKQIGVIPAVIFAVLCAGLPDLIVYSRYGWDSSETGLVMLLVFYFAFSKRWWLCLVTEVIAVIVHPSNIFALIILIPLFMGEHSSSLIVSGKRTKILGILAVISAGLGIALLIYANRLGFSGILTGNVAHRIINLSGWLGLLSAFGDLISGVTLYRAIVTPVMGISLAVQTILVWLSLLSIIIPGCWYSIKRKNYRIIALLVGIIASLVLLNIAWGIDAFLPDHNRYSQFLIVPTILLLSLCLNEIFLRSKSLWKPISLALLLASLGLFSMLENYFVPMLTTGGQSDRSYCTGPMEPKVAVVSTILKDGSTRPQTIILAENYWIGEPIDYLISDHPGFKILFYNDLHLDKTAVEDILRKGGYVVGFYHNPLDTTVMQSIQNPDLARIEINKFSGKPILVIWHLRSSTAQNFIYPSAPSSAPNSFSTLAGLGVISK